MTETIKNVAGLIPTKIRAALYTLLGAAVALELVWDLVPSPLEGKLLSSLTVLGFGVALANTSD
jgi:hypothetical protein